MYSSSSSASVSPLHALMSSSVHSASDVLEVNSDWGVHGFCGDNCGEMAGLRVLPWIIMCCSSALIDTLMGASILGERVPLLVCLVEREM